MAKDRFRTYRYGVWAEYAAAFYLILKGYRILAMRYKTPVGEIDIVAGRKNILVFTEVKARPTYRQGLESITPRMKKRITKAASYYLTQSARDTDPEVRFDVIAFSPPFFIRHLDNAWSSVS